MRHYLIYIVYLILPSATFSQDYAGYQSYGGPCLSTGLEYSYWLRPLGGSSFTRSDGTYITHKITYKFRNSFDHTICFTYEIYNGNKRIEYGRGCIKPSKESTLASWALLESSYLPRLDIKNITFRRDAYKEYNVRCNEYDRKFYWNNSTSSSTSSSQKNNQNKISSSLVNRSYRSESNAAYNQKPVLKDSESRREVEINRIAENHRNELIKIASKFLEDGNYKSALLYYKRAQIVNYSATTNRIIANLENYINLRKEKRKKLTTNNPYYYDKQISDSEIRRAINEVLGTYGSSSYNHNSQGNSAINKENFLKDVLEKMSFNNVNIGHIIDESIERYDYPFGSTLSYLSEYFSFKSRTDEFGAEIGPLWDDYLENFMNPDPNYNIDKEYKKFEESVKKFILGLMSDKNGIVDFNSVYKKRDE